MDIFTIVGAPVVLQKAGVQKYSPDQPRDERGRFGEGSGGGIASGERASVSPAQETISRDAVRTRYGAPESQSVRDMNTWGDKQAQVIHEHIGFDQSEITALQYYQGTGYTRINNSLRTGKGEESKQQGARIKALDSAIDKDGITKPMTVYRGANVPELKGDPKTFVGKEITDKGFISTSFNGAFAGKWAGRDGVLLKINLPAGVKGLAVGGVTGDKRESEFLLGRNGKFRITGVSYKSRPRDKQWMGKLTVVHVEAVL